MLKRDERMPLLDVLNLIESLCPIKVSFNNVVLYNDYDSERKVDMEGFDPDYDIYGEIYPPEKVIPERLEWDLSRNDIYVTQIDIKIVDYHHSIVQMYGEKVPKNKLLAKLKQLKSFSVDPNKPIVNW